MSVATKPTVAVKAQAAKVGGITTKQAVAVVNPVQALREKIDSLLADRDALREQAELVESAPRSLEEAITDLDEVVASAAARVEVPVAWLAQRLNQAAAIASALCDPRADRAQPPSGFAVACWAMPQEVRDRLEHDLREAYRRLPQAVASEEERERKLKELRGKIATVEGEAATLWWQAVDGGLQLEPPEIHGGRLIGLPEPRTP
jgi:uncharacterized protein YfcZ (UPF0381/DUF406 family)